MPVFHFLPKVHKGLNPLTGRPIVAGIDSLKERLGQWIEQQLQPLVVELPRFPKDTKQLLNKLQNFEWKQGYKWTTCDFSSLYSSIPHALGLQAVSFFLSQSGRFSLALQEFIFMCLEYLLIHDFLCLMGTIISKDVEPLWEPSFPHPCDLCTMENLV